MDRSPWITAFKKPRSSLVILRFLCQCYLFVKIVASWDLKALHSPPVQIHEDIPAKFRTSLRAPGLFKKHRNKLCKSNWRQQATSGYCIWFVCGNLKIMKINITNVSLNNNSLKCNILLTDSCWMFIRQLTHYRGYYTTNPNNACWRANLPKWPYAPYTYTVFYPPNMGPMKWRLVIFPHVPRFPRSARDKSKSRPFVDHFHATIKPAITQPAERQKAN